MEKYFTSLKQALNKGYLKEKVARPDIEKFKGNLKKLLTHIDVEESEANIRDHLRDFLNDTWYKNEFVIASKGRTDLVIHAGKTAKSQAAVLFEVKRPKNTNEMVSIGNLNRKALQELILYYLRERIDHENREIKTLIITDIHTWFIFDENDFERYIYHNEKLLAYYRHFKEIEKNNDVFYKTVAKDFIPLFVENLNFTFFDIRDYKKAALDEDKENDKTLVPLYKIFSPPHLLRLPFANDSNSLDKPFYNELLHIIGLEETKKKIIDRKAIKDRNPGSLLENIIATLETEDCLRRLPNAKSYGDTRELQLFNVGLELVISWMNRILFLKLLEAQLLTYHEKNSDFRFLNFDRIKDFDELNELFFDVLAKNPQQRPDYAKTKFAKIPYLNSSLFEINELEADTVRINSLKDRLTLPLLPGSVLKKNPRFKNTPELRTLEYIFNFLDAYDFASEGSEDIQEENKTLINASVLGLIFEKINGYKDGSFFTPGFITMYMCRETIRSAVVQKFNEHHAWECDDLDDLKNHLLDRRSKVEILEANSVVNSLKICDPAVGSGHFLVSALNEIIAIKSELRILADSTGLRLTVEAKVENDELIVMDKNSLFTYSLKNGSPDSDRQRIQETLFREKQTLIENCLFGVDINPNSVKICRLRLWIELLKNSYYKKETQFRELETLPNIDINIKQGNSLISRFGLDEDLAPILKKFNLTISDYREYIRKYHHAKDKDEKRELLRLIEQMKSSIRTEINSRDPLYVDQNELKGKIFNLQQVGLFELSEAEKQKKSASLVKNIAKLKKTEEKIEAIKANVVFQNAFEWLFEFPEIINLDGKFVGFDCVVGNPPYFSMSKLKEQTSYFESSSYSTYSKGADIYCLFYERGGQILKNNGILTNITSNSWLRAIYGELLKSYFKDNVQLVTLLNIEDVQVFEEATVESNILTFQKRQTTETFPVCNLGDDYIFGESLSDYFSKNSIPFSIPQTSDWVLGKQETADLKRKIELNSTLLKNLKITIYRGITTGLNKAFIINEKTKISLESTDLNSRKIIKPILRGQDLKKYSHEFDNVYCICTFPSLELDIDNFKEIKKHLESIGQKRLEQSGNPESRKKTTHKWFETQDTTAYWVDFEKPKIIWGEIADKPKFSYDDENYYAEATTFLMTGERLKYLLAILNSKVSEWYFNIISTTTGMGTNRWKKYKLELLPIKIPTVEQEAVIEQLVNQILAIKKADSSTDTGALESEIDKLVYGLYELTEEEIELIEKT